MRMWALQTQKWACGSATCSGRMAVVYYSRTASLPFSVRLKRNSAHGLLRSDEASALCSLGTSCYRISEPFSGPHLVRSLRILNPRTGSTSATTSSTRPSASRSTSLFTCLASVLKVLRLVPLLLLGLGAFFIDKLPAVADLTAHGGGSSVVLHRAKATEIFASGWAGLAAGFLHTLTGPDHLAGLAPLCIGKAKLESALIGVLWGFGHGAGQMICGLLFLVLKGKLKIDLLQAWASRVLGLTLLAIGGVGLKEAVDVSASAIAVEGPELQEDVVNRKATHRLKTFATGLIHGVHPDAFFTILPALALPSRLAGGAYLVMFLLGTIISMCSYTTFIASCGEALENRLPSFMKRLAIGSSIIAIIFGLGILVGELFGINFFH
ncbi:hypothetical protein KP509_07G064400 [Ceratopteris richardii]|uniref:Urease accessory protein UreH-like transmembrane domain-containing protein n=1 Tax=Ceratopteris richardii TaxID=49495 RepID=A0A8T2UFQ6_CERRI|nr:hypothetical protein KP509_07G064400 [Ceratopteris richardii]